MKGKTSLRAVKLFCDTVDKKGPHANLTNLGKACVVALPTQRPKV